MHESKRPSISVDEYARLQDIAREAGTEIIIFPGGGHDECEKSLTCQVCGRFVCYRHNPKLKPGYKEDTVRIPTPEHNGWSRPIPQRIIDRFTDGLVVKP